MQALDKEWVRRSFDRASHTYDAAAVVQGDARTQLLDRLDLVTLTPRVVLDLGCGTGHATQALKRRYPHARVVGLDSSPGMLRVARRQRSWLRGFDRICADAERLPLPDASVDLIFSNFLLSWTQPDVVFDECRRVLTPRGLLTFTAAGPDTLRELRSAWCPPWRGEEADANPFIDMHDLGDALVRAGFAAPVLDVERYTLQYRDLHHLAADLRATGSRVRVPGRAPGLCGSATFTAAANAYEAYRRDGRLPATCEVVFGQAWAPAASPGAGAEPGGTTAVSLAELTRQLPSRRSK